MLKIETDRLLLRSLRQSDIPALVGLWTDPLVTKYIGGPRKREALEKGFEEDLNSPPPESDDLWPVIEKSTSKIVGHCGLLEKEIDGGKETELIYVFCRSSWGNGYAAEIGSALKKYASQRLGLERLVALIDPENIGSGKVAKRVGFKKEKTIMRTGGKERVLYGIDLKKIEIR